MIAKFLVPLEWAFSALKDTNWVCTPNAHFLGFWMYSSSSMSPWRKRTLMSIWCNCRTNAGVSKKYLEGSHLESLLKMDSLILCNTLGCSLSWPSEVLFDMPIYMAFLLLGSFTRYQVLFAWSDLISSCIVSCCLFESSHVLASLTVGSSPSSVRDEPDGGMKFMSASNTWVV